MDSTKRLSDTAILLIVVVPVLVIAILVSFAIRYTREKERELAAALELPRSQRVSVLKKDSDLASQTKKSTRVNLDVISVQFITIKPVVFLSW